VVLIITSISLLSRHSSSHPSIPPQPIVIYPAMLQRVSLAAVVLSCPIKAIRLHMFGKSHIKEAQKG